jgi:hypothetical protein
MSKLMTAAGLVAVCLTITGCQVNKTQDAKAPEVKMTASGGQLPKYDVKGPDVSVGTKKETVEVPTVHVTPADKR